MFKYHELFLLDAKMRSIWSDNDENQPGLSIHNFLLKSKLYISLLIDIFHTGSSLQFSA